MPPKAAGVLTGLAGLSAAALSAAVVVAQPLSSSDALARILAEAAGQSVAMDTARTLTNTYGPRLTGSPHLRAVGSYVVERLTGAGIPGARLERWGPFGPGWTSDHLSARVVAPTTQALVVFPKAWTPGIEGNGVGDAILAVITNEDQFARFRGRLKGRYVLTVAAGPEPPTPLSSTFLRRRMEFFIDEGVLALLEPGGANGAVVVGDGRLADDAAFGGQGFYPWPDAVAAQVVVATEQYDHMARLLERGTTVTLDMNIVNTYHPADPDSFNVLAELPGTSADPEIVMVGAHLDSWHAGTGASDNAAGCAVVLEALRILRATGLPLGRTVRLALWTGGEQSQLGSRAYVTERFADPSVMEVRPAHARLALYINLDAGADTLHGASTHGNDALAPLVHSWISPLHAQGHWSISADPGAAGDHVAFDAVGLPVIDLVSTSSEDARRVRHSNLDTFDRLDERTLRNNAATVAWLLYQAANHVGRIPRKPLPPPNPAAAGPWSPGR